MGCQVQILIYKAACVCVSDTGHLVPGTNSEIEGLTLTKSGTIGKSGTNNRKEWD